MANGTTLMTFEEVKSIPQEHLPIVVLSADASAFFSSGIRLFKKCYYNHFMWMHRTGYFATQGFTYSEKSVDDYTSKTTRYKFWHNPDWTTADKATMLAEIYKWLEKPAFTTRYDWIAIIGQALGLAWIQNPFTRICSDYGSLLKKVDFRYDLKNPSPDQVNKWLKKWPKTYQVYGRYTPD